MKNKYLIGAGLLGLGFLAMRGRASARSLSNLQVSFSNFKIQFSGFTPVLLFRINAYNPDTANVNITNVLGNVVFKNKSISTFNSSNSMSLVVRPKQTVAIESRATLSLGAIVQALVQKMPGAKVEVQGVINTNGIEIPFIKTWEPATNAVQ